VAKKRAFLKEVARACEWEGVEVLGERVEAFARSQRAHSFAAATSRALGHYQILVPPMLRCLKPDGSLFLWVTRMQGSDLGKLEGAVEWQSPLRIPLTDQGEIWQGIKKTAPQRPRRGLS